MDDRRLEEQDQAQGAKETEVGTGNGEELDVAMREALEAVERHEDEAPDAAEASADEPAEGMETELDAELVALKERHVRTLADFENFRKRVEREQAKSRRYEGLGVLSELLPILDNLGLALGAEGDVEDLKVGVELIARQFQDLLRRHGVERIDAEGKPFDPTLHDAVSREEDPDIEVATVAEELRAGYVMGDRLVRPASVRVRVPADSNAVRSDEVASEGQD